MRQKTRWFILVCAVCSVMTFGPVQVLGSDPGGFDPQIRAGFAKIDVTPPIGTPLSGYGRRHGDPSKGIKDLLYARTISLTQKGETFYFVSFDNVLVDEHLRNVVLQKVRREIEVPDDHLVLAATHTHSGSGAIGGRFWQRFIGGRFDRKIFEKTTDLIAASVIQSFKNQRTVAVEYGEIDAGNLTENRLDENLPASALLRVIRFKHGSNVLGQLVFFAAHPTLYSADNRHFSADFPGVLTRLLEEKYAKSTSLFINGAAGDIRPSGIYSDYPEKRVERYGQVLFEKVESIRFKPLALEGPWQAEIIRVKLPDTKVARFVPAILSNRFLPRHAYFQVVRLGNIAFMALPGEIASEIGREIEARAAGKGFRLFVIGFANDYIGYVIPERYYLDRSEYESRTSLYGHRFDFFVHQTVDQLLNALDNRSSQHESGKLIIQQELPVIFVRGSDYEMGYQQGELMQTEIQQAKKEIYHYLAHHVIYIPFFSGLISKWILSRTWKKMAPYVSYGEWQELKGLADGTGLKMKDVKRLHAIPDLIEHLCANGVYFDRATQSRRLIHLRNLDWIRDMGIQDYAALIVYQPERGIPYVNIGYYGFAGVISGFNAEGISVGQVGADSIDETLRGTPMPFLLKRILREANSLERASEIIIHAPRTSAFNYVFGDAKHKQALAIETTAHHYKIFTDNDPMEIDSGYGLAAQNILVRADTAFDPVIRNLQTASKGKPDQPGLEPPAGSAYETRYKKQAELAQAAYGELTPGKVIEIAKDIAPDSNVQSVVYAFPDFWVANATDELPAARTEYKHFNYDQLVLLGSDPSGSDPTHTY